MIKPLPRLLLRAQDRLLHLLGNTQEGRAPLVASMLRRDASEATSYWLQLVVSVGIATLGLVVGSTAVVIGAMLVAPLMSPIVGLAMGLAAGSPFLVLRSAGRIGLSVLVAVGGAALITRFLPFYELNAEIAARTSPTVLDLITAGFCALAGVYASLRPGSDTATTAAGTSISISLVPPLCASGYGLGIMAWPVAGGAALLFLTNLVAIVVIGTVAFVAAGFNRVDVLALERAELEDNTDGARLAKALARRLSSLFESRILGPLMRFLMPFALLAAVYVPLRHALDEVAWQVRVRAAVRESIAREPLRVVQSRVRVERRQVEVVMVVLGKTEDAERSRARLDAELRELSGVTPRLEVLAVPDANAIAGLESSLLTARPLEAVIASTPPPPNEQLDAATTRVRSAFAQLWPSDASGEPLVIDLGTAAEAPLRIRVFHLGPPVAADTLETLRRAVGKELAREVIVADVALPSAPLTRAEGDLAFIARVAAATSAASSVPGLNVCATRPAEPDRRRRVSPADRDLALALEPLLARHPNVAFVTGEAWSVLLTSASCPLPPAPPAPPGSPAGPDDDRASVPK